MGSGSTVFDADRLVLLWPLGEDQHTVEGVGVGSPVHQLWSVYPDAEVLRREPDAAPDAALVVRVDRAYLMLHDGSRVRRVLAGTEPLLRAAYLA